MECLIVGPQFSGKTSLLNRLKWLNKRAAAKGKKNEKEDRKELPELPAFLPTVGTNIGTLTFDAGESKKAPTYSVQLRESGGAMAPVWNKYYDDAAMFMFVLDGSNPYRLSAATILLLEVLGDAKMKDKPAAVVFNKTDIDPVLSFNEMTAIMRMNDIVKSQKDLSVFQTSSLLCEGVQELLDWVESKSIL